MFSVCKNCGKALPDHSFSTVWCDPCLDEYILKHNITKQSPRVKNEPATQAKNALTKDKM